MSGPLDGVAGAILAGGSSRRMGRDKALVDLDGQPLVARARDALLDAGAAPVVAVGGDRAALGAVGLEVVADTWPGEGPLGGLVTALEHLAGSSRAVVVLTCDLAAIGAEEVVRLVAHLGAHPGASAAVPVVDDMPQLLTAAWRPGAAPALRRAFEAGERSVRRAVAALDLEWVAVADLDPGALVDVDTPDDLRAVVTGAPLAVAYPPRPMDIAEIDVAAAAARRAAGAVVVDVRNPDEYEAGHVPGAVLIPLPELAARVGDVPAADDLLVICRSGARSRTAAEHLATVGITATNIAGGTLAWVDAGHDVAVGPDPG